MAREPRNEAPRSRRGASGGLLRTAQLFGEVALAGVMIAVGSLLIVTLVPSLAAGVAHLRREIHGHPTSLRRFAVEWWAATRTLWPLGPAALGLAVLLLGDWQLATSGVLPGGEVVALVVAVFTAGAIVVGLRAAGAWSDDDGAPDPSARTPTVLSTGADRTVDDAGGSVLLLAAVLMTAVVLWMLPLLALVVGGLLALAVVAVEIRRRPRP
ncbi:hypothetical protein ACNHYB_08890 [Isoptericola jiangsuensis]|uniref:hypothetical protein n=1 Tax=Isoptericola jiangsuensis TaxID=548579 RepID=UPI003AAB17B1